MNHSLVYVAGPMTGIPEQNAPLFLEVRARLMAFGMRVIDPLMVNINFMGIQHPEIPNPAAPGLRADMVALAMCDSICLLPGWENSIGARLEAAIAITLGFTFVDYLTGKVVPRPDFVIVTHGYGERPPLQNQGRP